MCHCLNVFGQAVHFVSGRCRSHGFSEVSEAVAQRILYPEIVVYEAPFTDHLSYIARGRWGLMRGGE